MPRTTFSWSAGLSALAFFLAGLFPLFNADAYGHLAQGRQIAELGHVPRVDLFSFWRPEPQPWNNYEWAYDYLTWLVYDGLGANALILLKCFALALLGYLLVSLAGRLGRGAASAAPLVASALLLALPVARFRFTVRPQIVGLLFPALLLVGISALFRQDSSTRRKAIVLTLLALLHVVWVNMHGSHLFGFAIAVVFAAAAVCTPSFRWMVALIGLQVGATACTPFGFAIATDAISHVFDPEYRELVVEWAAWSPKDPLRLLIGPIVAALFVLLAMRPVVRSSRFGLGYGVFCVLISLMAFRSMRFVAHQLLFSAPFIAAGLARTSGVFQRPRFAGALVVAAGVTAMLWTPQLLPNPGFGLGEPKREYPWASAEVIEAGVNEPRIVASLADSWALMFAAPSARFLVDGRVPFYGPEMIRSVARSFTDGARFAVQLSEYDVNTVVIDHTRSDHIAATEYLRAQPDWGLVFVEDGHSVFVRRAAAPKLAPFRILAPGYRVGRLLATEVDEGDIWEEAMRASDRLNTESIRAWHQGLILLRPLTRAADRAGVRKVTNASEADRARTAVDRFATASQRFPGFTSIELYLAMAALSVCDVGQARAAYGRALYGGQTRETLLVGLELALRGGTSSERASAVIQLENLLRSAEGQADPWVRAIATEIDERCR